MISAKLGAIDALTIRTNAYRNHDDVRNQAVSSRNQASLLDMQAKNSRTAGMLGAFGSVMSGLGGAYANAVKMNPGTAVSGLNVMGTTGPANFWPTMKPVK